MTYYRVKSQYDQKRHPKGFLIANEPYTQRELVKIGMAGMIPIITYFDKTNISKRKVFWIFGARFQSSIS